MKARAAATTNTEANTFYARKEAAKRYIAIGEREVLAALIDGDGGIYGFYPLRHCEIRLEHEELVTRQAKKQTDMWVNLGAHLRTDGPTSIRHMLIELKKKRPGMVGALVAHTGVIKRAIKAIRSAERNKKDGAYDWALVLAEAVSTERDAQYVFRSGKAVCFELMTVDVEESNGLPEILPFAQLLARSLGIIPIQEWMYWLGRAWRLGVLNEGLRRGVGKVVGQRPKLFALSVEYADKQVLWDWATAHWRDVIKQDAMVELVAAVEERNIQILDNQLLAQALADGTPAVREALHRRLGARWGSGGVTRSKADSGTTGRKIIR